jgi:hypothetical protein
MPVKTLNPYDTYQRYPEIGKMCNFLKSYLLTRIDRLLRLLDQASVIHIVDVWPLGRQIGHLVALLVEPYQRMRDSRLHVPTRRTCFIVDGSHIVIYGVDGVVRIVGDKSQVAVAIIRQPRANATWKVGVTTTNGNQCQTSLTLPSRSLIRLVLHR